MSRPRKPEPKKLNNEGSCRPYRGKWRVQVTIGIKANGQANRLDRLYPTQAEGVAALEQFRQQFYDHSGKMPTVANLAEAWYKSESGGWEISRRRIVEGEIRNHIIKSPTIGHVLADRLGRQRVKDWMQHMADADLVWPTIKTYRQHLSSIYLWAMEAGMPGIHQNPVPRKFKPRNMKASKDKTWLTLDEARAFITYCSQPSEPWGPYFLTCAMLGLRPGEGFGIGRRAIDFDEGTVHIGWALKRNGDAPVELGPTKTEDVRTLRAGPIVLEALRRQIDAQEIARMVHSDQWPARWGDLVFLATKTDKQSKLGYPVNQSNVRTNLTRVCAAAKIRRVTPYELRHSCASILLDRPGANPMMIAKMLGTSEEMLPRHYHHLMSPVIEEGAVAWAEIMETDG